MIAALALLLALQSALPRELPRAEPGRWAEWKPDAPIPAEVQAAFARGVEAYHTGDQDTALKELYDVLRRAPDYPAALYQAGIACFRLRRYGDAAELFERFVAAVPSEVGATRVLGHCYYSVGEYRRAAAHYERVRVVASDDAGNLINPLIVEGQIHGGLAQGIGQAMIEEAVYSEDGQLLTGSFMDYALPRATDFPKFEMHSTCTPTPVNPLGAKGVGEAGTLGSTPCVVAAAVDALSPFGVKHIDMMLRPEKLWRIIQAPRQGSGQGGAS